MRKWQRQNKVRKETGESKAIKELVKKEKRRLTKRTNRIILGKDFMHSFKKALKVLLLVCPILFVIPLLFCFHFVAVSVFIYVLSLHKLT